MTLRLIALRNTLEGERVLTTAYCWRCCEWFSAGSAIAALFEGDEPFVEPEFVPDVDALTLDTCARLGDDTSADPLWAICPDCLSPQQRAIYDERCREFSREDV